MPKPLRIGNAQAFWGDSTGAPARLLQQVPDLDYLTLDYLAEVSLSIMARQHARDPAAGYARDFVDVVKSIIPYWQAGGRCRIIANAGGLNPRGCAEACRQALVGSGCRPLRIAVVSGDDVRPLIRAAVKYGEPTDSFKNLETEEPISTILDQLVTANAYLGAEPIVRALADGADIVITGRVADPSLTVAPCIYHFGWSGTDHDRIAGATVAGHLIECGTQVTGGIATDWLDMPDPARLGFPIVEVAADGSCVVAKPPGTGGRVSPRTVKEQLLYEIGDPDNYFSPDVTVSFLSLSVREQGPDRIAVSGAVGRPAPPTYKVSATYSAGYRAQGMLTIFGRDAAAKARRCGEIVLQRVREAGHSLAQTSIECLGVGDCVPGVLTASARSGLIETVLRIAVSDPSQAAVECFTKELMPLVTAGPQGTTGYSEGRPRVHPVFGYWPCLIDRNEVEPLVEVIDA